MATRLSAFPAILVRSYIAGSNVYIVGKPAMGKTEMIKAFCEKMKQKDPGFGVWTFYAPTMSPMDIQASAPNYETHRLDMFNNSALPNAYDTPDLKGVIFFGELPNADPSTAKLLQKYINGEDMSGCLRKPDGVMVVADGNRLEDKSGVQQQGRALMSRFEHHEAFSDANDNTLYAEKANWHPLVQTFFKDNPALIDNYDEVFETAATSRSKAAQQTNGSNDQLSQEGKRGIWANMRAWERISKKEYAADQLQSEVTVQEVAGNVGAGVAAKYEAHKKIIHSLASYEDIVANPDTAPIPVKMDEKYMLSMIVALKAKMEQFVAIKTYAQRMPLEYQAVILRQMAMRKGFGLSGNPEYLKWITTPELNKLLNGR